MLIQENISRRVTRLAAVDWDRRLFDALIPLPDGTSYNSYLVRGTEKTALIDTVDPSMTAFLLSRLADVPRLDYIVSNHSEQDHSGAIPAVLEKYPEAKVLATPRGKDILGNHLPIAPQSLRAVEDGEKISLGDCELAFIHTPWVHWPETMVTWLEAEKTLFSCDFFGAHLAAAESFVIDEARVFEASKRYFAEIMMPFRPIARKNLEKLSPLESRLIAPSHGQVHRRPGMITDAYREWTSDEPRNLVTLAFVSMHGSTRLMVDRLTGALAERGVSVDRFELTGSDPGKLAMSLLDAATIVIGTPTVLTGPHPLAASAAFLANALRPKARFLSVIGSYGWGGRTVETLKEMLGRVGAEILDPVLTRGMPDEDTFEAIDRLADLIALKHEGLAPAGNEPD